MPEIHKPHAEDGLLVQAAVESGLNPDLLRQLLEIRRRDFPSLHKWGARAKFEHAVGDLVTKAAQQAEQTTQA